MRNEQFKALEYATRQLEIEWERTGETKHVIKMEADQVRNLLVAIQKEITMREEVHGMLIHLSYPEFIGISHENYILLRLCKKVLKAYEQISRKKAKHGKVNLDKEEIRVMKKLLENKE